MHESTTSVAGDELGVEVHQLCRRVLGPGSEAREVANAALAGIPRRLEALGRAARECRRRPQGGRADPTPQAAAVAGEADLAAAVAAEAAEANRAVDDDGRVALALREMLGLSYAEMSLVMALEEAALGPLLARSRLAFRASLRGSGAGPDTVCNEGDRALRALARRQDSEAADDQSDWIMEHMAQCAACAEAHAAMLEASVCYRGWGRGR